MPVRGHPDRDMDNDGLTPLQAEFIDWLMTEPIHRQPQSQNEWAREHDIGSGTVSGWKRNDPFFIGALKKRVAEKGLDPESLHAILQAMTTKGTKGDVQAAKLAFDMVKWLDPNPPTPEQRDVRDLTDDELADELEAAIAELRG